MPGHSRSRETTADNVNYVNPDALERYKVIRRKKNGIGLWMGEMTMSDTPNPRL